MLDCIAPSAGVNTQKVVLSRTPCPISRSDCMSKNSRATNRARELVNTQSWKELEELHVSFSSRAKAVDKDDDDNYVSDDDDDDSTLSFSSHHDHDFSESDDEEEDILLFEEEDEDKDT